MVKKIKTKNNAFNKGPWSEEEHDRFLAGLEKFGTGKHSEISAFMGTRSRLQVASHSQKYFLKIQKNKNRRCIRRKIKIPNQQEHCYYQGDAPEKKTQLSPQKNKDILFFKQKPHSSPSPHLENCESPSLPFHESCLNTNFFPPDTPIFSLIPDSFSPSKITNSVLDDDYFNQNNMDTP